MRPDTFKAFSQLIYDHCGIVLHDGKQSLMSTRIGRRLKALDLPDEEAYLKFVSAPGRDDEMVQLIDAISTNVTHFYRESKHFEMLDEICRKLAASGIQKFRLWCAAAATGEEPYTLAMVLSEAFKGHKIDAKILATDISTRALQACGVGEYQKQALDKLPDKYAKNYLKPSGTGTYLVDPRLKQMILFRRLNLIEFPYRLRGGHDIIICRNVMIYFDDETRNKIVRQFERLLKPGATLFSGMSESLTGIEGSLERIGPSVYRKPGGDG